jgi:hypothetical protein
MPTEKPKTPKPLPSIHLLGYRNILVRRLRRRLQVFPVVRPLA